MSDKDWLRRHTALYTIQAHGMDNIVQFFAPETGQIRIDERDNLKIKVVVDWPNGVGFRRSKEYRSFFKWANQFNNYNPDITDDNFQVKGYHPRR